MRALDRVVAILECVAVNSTDGWTLTAIAAASGINLATTSRLVKDMAAAGLLIRTEATGTYRLGPRLVAMGRMASRRGMLLDIAPSHMNQLRDKSRETISLHIRVAGHRVCGAEVQSPEEVRRVVPVGLTLPLHTGATGLALLAHLTQEDRDEYLAAVEGRTIRETLAQAVDEIRSAGFAWAVDALARGVSGVAAPVMEAGAAVAVLSVSGPSFRWTELRMREFASELVDQARQVSRELGDA
jgi:IclR family transcriptional regulator, acetate operon repressor